MSHLSIGIVGLPNVGKSTLFNALTKQQVPAENYPFCTINPNIGVVKVPDLRLDKLAQIVNPQKITPAFVDFVDIAGLVKGASKGEGLGNQFLAHIREVDLIAHIIRFFPSEKVAHVEEKVDPARDRAIVEMELMLKDLESVSKKIEKIEGLARTASKDSIQKRQLLFWQGICKRLEEGNLIEAWDPFSLTSEEKQWLLEVPLLSTKKFLYVANTGKGQSISKDEVKTILGLEKKDDAGKNHKKAEVIIMDILEESDLVQIARNEGSKDTEPMNLGKSGLNKLIKRGYELLGLQTFFTAGEQEARAWTVLKGASASEAAGVIHTDFATHFIAMEVVSYEDFIAFGGWAGAKENGKVRLEGRNYIIKDGDVVLVKHNA